MFRNVITFLGKHKGLVAMGVFLALLGVTGYALASSGHFENSFRVFSQFGGVSGGGREGRIGEGSGRAGRGTPPTNAQGRPAEGNFGRGEGGQNQFVWSQVGDVLFDIWFLFAVTAAVMLIQWPISLFFKARRRRRRSAPAPVTV